MTLKFLLLICLSAAVAIGTPTCGKNEVFSTCGNSEDTNCYDRNPMIDRMCHHRCVCVEEHVVHNGTCIPTADCKKHCGENEEFLECGNPCEPPCHRPQRKPCEGCEKNVCRCKKGFVRDLDGACKLSTDCIQYDDDNSDTEY